MTGWQVALLVAGLMSIDLIVVGAIMHYAVQVVFEPLTRTYPPRPPADTAHRREFQSIDRDRMNFGWCVHIAADDTHLHMFPAWLPRICKAQPSSIPWDAIAITKRGRWTWRIAIKDAGEYGVPRWIGELAES
ncbi:MAG TPA: hypothetical protein VHN77_07795 [Phycisphaerales bacterium]|nr:hypothetical protein [Phycisphaerales bacterium]